MTEAKIGETKTRLEKEQIEMQKLLNDSNEIFKRTQQRNSFKDIVRHGLRKKARSILKEKETKK